MTEQPMGTPEQATPPPAPADRPTPDIAAFISFCHARRNVGWPDLYDEMCAVAARREFNGWGHDELEARGVTFSLWDMPRLAGWVRVTLGASSVEGGRLSASRVAPRRLDIRAAPA